MTADGETERSGGEEREKREAQKQSQKKKKSTEDYSLVSFFPFLSFPAMLTKHIFGTSETRRIRMGKNLIS